MSLESAPPSVHADLARHQESMKPKIFTLNGHIHTAFGKTPGIIIFESRLRLRTLGSNAL
jgi:hypothetical protein